MKNILFLLLFLCVSSLLYSEDTFNEWWNGLNEYEQDIFVTGIQIGFLASDDLNQGLFKSCNLDPTSHDYQLISAFITSKEKMSSKISVLDLKPYIDITLSKKEYKIDHGYLAILEAMALYKLNNINN